jgi:hypothetical protein
VPDDHNDNDCYECVAVSASVIGTDRINLSIWRRDFIVKVTVSRLFYATLDSVSKRQGKNQKLYFRVHRVSK